MIVGCSSSPDIEKLYGEYQADFAYGVERLALRSNGTYEQRLTLKATGEGVTHIGRWEYRRDGGVVIVNDPLLFDDNFGKLNPEFRSPVSGGWHLDVRERFGSFRLVWNEDFGSGPTARPLTLRDCAANHCMREETMAKLLSWPDATAELTSDTRSVRARRTGRARERTAHWAGPDRASLSLSNAVTAGELIATRPAASGRRD